MFFYENLDIIIELRESESVNQYYRGNENDKNWVKGYDHVLDPMNRLSADFHNKFDDKKIDARDREYREALLYLLLSQTSCFRYWGGQSLWTDYAKELCRRGMERVT